jgi:peptidoglycan/LPS O-acetylase OafA/YrhL
VSFPNRYQAFSPFSATHLRIDSILIGVLVSYLYYFKSSSLDIITKNKMLAGLLSFLMVSVSFFYHGGSFVMNTVGLTSVQIGFALLLILTPEIEIPSFPIVALIKQAISSVRKHSYTIYLWHLFILELLVLFIKNRGLYIPLYFFASISVGFFISICFEKNVLRARDKLFPS